MDLLIPKPIVKVFNNDSSSINVFVKAFPTLIDLHD